MHRPPPVVIVTGAGEGIGYEIARRVGESGGAVVLNDLEEARAREAAARIAAEGSRCLAAPGDVADLEVVRELVRLAREKFGRLDAVIANAGLTHRADFLDYEPADFDRVVAVNLRGSFFLAREGARAMREQGEGGRILLMSSVLGDRAVPGAAAYAMTKGGIRMLARAIAIDVAPFRITVNTIAPGATVTPRTLLEDADYPGTWSRLNPLGRVGTPSDIADVVLFLLSPAADHITGQTITVDGGWSLLGAAGE
jgi:glucose 1-dehydrogenase